MAYRVVYDRQLAEIEEYHTEHEALRRARDLLDDGDHETVLVADDDGNTLAGVRLQLRLGFARE